MLKTLVLMIVLFCSCSVEQEKAESPTGHYLDSDGDSVTDQDELNQGRSPFIADLPEIRVQFLQNYSITIHYLEKDEQKEFKIDTQIARGQAKFQYQVGGLMAHHLAIREAAKIGAYHTHHFGGFAEQDLTWIQYPHIDEKFYLKAMSKFDPSWNIKNITITLENSIKLKANGLYNSIKNLELNFRYYDHERENYVHLGTKKWSSIFPQASLKPLKLFWKMCRSISFETAIFGGGSSLSAKSKILKSQALILLIGNCWGVFAKRQLPWPIILLWIVEFIMFLSGKREKRVFIKSSKTFLIPSLQLKRIHL